MALFGLKNKKETKEPVKTTKTVKTKISERNKESQTKSLTVLPNVNASVVSSGIIRPLVTEKSGILSQSGVYTFEISRSANKRTVSTSITALYKVIPAKVAIINLPSKNVFVRGRKGVVPGIRKALVTLKKGDKIDFV